MDEAVQLLALIVSVAVVAASARRLGLNAPLVLVVIGVLASFVPGVPEYHLDPDVVLFGLLPPLLYAAAIRTSLVDFRANRQAIGILAVGAVVFTALLVGLVVWAVVPGVPLAAGFALGAVVAPPDAVAATTIARRVGMPRRIVAILEGESLVNDATALVSLRTAAAAITATATITVWSVAGDFALAVFGGVAVGIAMAVILGAARKRVQDPVLDTTLSLVAPFLAYLPAEAIHSSGVLAVVVTGLLLGHKSPVLQSAASRLSEQTNWRTVQFVLENTVFLLIGLQVSEVVQAAQDDNFSNTELIVISLAVLVTTVLARIIWVFGATAAYKFGPKRMRQKAWAWAYATLISWSGMRGVVTLAAAFILPEETPHRDVLVLAAFAVVGGTLLLHGTTLPWLVRRLGLPGPDPAEDALEEAALLSRATRAGLARLDELRSDDIDPHVIDRLEERARSRADAAWEQLGLERVRDPQRELPPAPAGDARRRAPGRPAGARHRQGGRRDPARGHEHARQRGVAAGPAGRQGQRRRTRAGRAQRSGGSLRAPPRGVQRRPAAHARGVRGVPARRHPLGAPAAVPGLRSRRLLRLVAAAARDQAPRGDRRPGDPQLRAGRGLALVLRRRPPGLSLTRAG